MNLKRMIFIMIAIIIFAAYILIVKILSAEEDIVSVEVEPLPIEILLDPMIGSEPPTEEIHVLVNNKDLLLLANLIDLEAGSDWCTDELQMAVGSVVQNRVGDDRYPDTLQEVIFQEGQYSTANSIKGHIPSERALKNARYLLLNGSQLSEEYVFQANFKQGKDIMQIQNLYFGS